MVSLQLLCRILNSQTFLLHTFQHNLAVSTQHLSWAIPPVRLALSGRNSGKIPERPRKRSQSVSGNSRREYGWDAPNPCNSRHLRLPEHFQNYLLPSTAGDASFFRSGSGEGLPEPAMEFPAILGVFLISWGVEPSVGP